MRACLALPALLLLALPQPARGQTGPDLSLGNVTLTPGLATIGSTVTLSGVLVASPSYSGPVGIAAGALFAPPNSLGRTSVTMAGSVAAFSTTFVIGPGVSAGSYLVNVTADPDNLIAESNETNNTWSAVPSLNIVTADLEATRLVAPPVGTVGVPYVVQATISNLGGVDASGFTYGYYLGRNPVGPPLLTGGPLTLAPGGSVVQQDTIMLPNTPGMATLTLWVNSDLRVPESALNNNVRTLPISIRTAEPDLQGRLLTFNGTAELGQSLTLNGQIQNLGDAAAPVVPYAVVLSSDASIGASDRELHRAVTAMPVDPGQTAMVQDTFIIPSDIAPGLYYLGLLADPDATITESNEANNAALGLLVQLFESEILITTQSLPEGMVGVSYSARLQHMGGAFAPDWSITQGRLPSGLALISNTGAIEGRPEEAGSFGITVRVVSGGASSQAQFILRIRASSEPLIVDTVDLPFGVAGRPYDYQLVASGGTAPLTWQTSDPPAGLAVGLDGRLMGTPTVVGTTAFDVQVSDALGTVAQGTLVLEVLDPSNSVRISQVLLPDGTVGQEYCEPEPLRLGAEGGVAPLVWSVDEGLPPGLTLARTGALCGVPTAAGVFDFVVRVQDAQGVFDSSGFRLQVSAQGAAQVTTDALPDAVVGAAYAAQLEAEGAAPLEFSLAQNSLPPGLALSPSGQISGVAQQVGAYAFVAQVQDANGARDSAVLSIKVVAPSGIVTKDGASGCHCVSGPARRPAAGRLSLALMLGLGVVLRRRRGR